VKLLLAFALVAAAVQAADCVPDLPNLTYPQPAWQQRIMGTVTVEFKVDERGAATSIASKGSLVLVAGAEEAVRSGGFGPACRGKQLSIRLSYRLDSDLEPTTSVTVRHEAPMAYEIIAPANRIIINVYDHAAAAPRKNLCARTVGLFARLRFW
jgi:TonB family protein